MVIGVWGKKIGMTQIFDNERVIPVTVINLDHWIVTNIKRKDRDGYEAVQVGCLRDKYISQPFSLQWLKNLKKYFSHIREIKDVDIVSDVKIGQPAEFYTLLKLGDSIDISGITKGCGFAGVVKRYGFSGPPGSHGSTMGNRPGSIGSFCSQGKVVKGKRLPGHKGVQKRFIRRLKVVRIEPEMKIMLVKGSVPGKVGSLLFVRKA
ncbi:50S ribosomal protein L3 [Candidatus Dependentiae bacterium]|nr:MAG: 50S ribosomal protein L3 [Candidatus Dependentiae bacterium]